MQHLVTSSSSSTVHTPTPASSSTASPATHRLATSSSNMGRHRAAVGSTSDTNSAGHPYMACHPGRHQHRTSTLMLIKIMMRGRAGRSSSSRADMVSMEGRLEHAWPHVCVDCGVERGVVRDTIRPQGTWVHQGLR